MDMSLLKKDFPNKDKSLFLFLIKKELLDRISRSP